MNHNSHPRDSQIPTGPAGSAGDSVDTHLQDGVAVLTLAGAEGNRMGPGLVAALATAVAAALADPAVRALVLTGRGADFCAGPWADLPPPGPEAAPLPPVMAALADLCGRLADSPKPVVCALHGRVASGGFALALAARARLSDARARLSFPESGLGRLPPGGGAVRLAWLAGAEGALAVLRPGTTLGAAEAMGLGLVDRVVEGAVVPEAIALAAALRPAPAPPPTPGLDDAAGFRAAVTRARAALPAPLPPQRRVEALILDSIEAAQVLPPEQALAFDLVRAQDAALAPVARALAHLARATRRALETPETRRAAPPLHTSPVAAALAPGLAARIVPAVLRGGPSVTLVAPEREALAETLEAVAEAQLDRVRAGRMTQAQSEADWQRLSGRHSPDPAHPPAVALADAGHALWLAGQWPDAPMVLWSPRGRGLPQGLDPVRAVELVPAPGPAPKVCEIVVHDTTDPAAVRQASALAMAMRMTPLRAGSAPWLGRMGQALAQAAARLRGLGVSVEALCAGGLIPAALAEGPVADTRTRLPLPVERLLVLAAITEGTRLLESGAVLRPSDLDLGMVLGAGWPGARGGPMAEGDTIGPLVLRHELRQAAALDAHLWSPEPMVDEMLRNGWRFEDLNTG